MSLPKVHVKLQGLNFWIDELGRVKGNVSIDILNQFIRKHVPDKKLLVRDGPWKNSVIHPTISEELIFAAEMNQKDDIILDSEGNISLETFQDLLHTHQSFSIMANAADTKSKIKSKIGKKNIISTASAEPMMGRQNPDEDNMPDEPADDDENQLVGTLTSQIPEPIEVQPMSIAASQPAAVATTLAPPTGGRKVSANGGIQLAYIVHNGQLHSLRPDEFDGLDLTDLEGSMKGRRTLKHNPTNVHKTAEGLRSNEDRRPMFYVEEGVLVRKDTTPVPEKVATAKGEKSAKVVKAGGPNIIYIDDHRYAKAIGGGSHLYSLNASQFADVFSGKVKLDGHKILIHLPTCVTRDAQGFLHSNEPERRPMYRFQLANTEAGIAEDGIIAVDVAEAPVQEPGEVTTEDENISESQVESVLETLDAGTQDSDTEVVSN